MLVLFIGASISALSGDNYELFRAVYKAVPSPCPYARLLLNNSIYFPLVLKSKEKTFFFHEELQLIGFKRNISTNTRGETNIFYICIYSNISNISFVSTIDRLDNLNEFYDDYLKEEINLSMFYDFRNCKNETISFKITLENANKYFCEKRERLIDVLCKEMKNN